MYCISHYSQSTPEAAVNIFPLFLFTSRAFSLLIPPLVVVDFSRPLFTWTFELQFTVTAAGEAHI